MGISACYNCPEQALGENCLGTNVTISRAGPPDTSSILALVREVVEDVYGHLLQDPHRIQIAHSEDWWVAQVNGTIIGAGRVKEDYISDLWVKADHRDRGVGAALLKQLEQQIASSGHLIGRLRVVLENDGARQFYRKLGWDEIRIYPHERDGHMMVDCHKRMN